MPLPRRSLAVVAVLGLASFPAAIARKRPATSASDERSRAVQALNRLTFGPRPGDVDRVLASGVDKWIDQQLHPESIDDQALDARLEQFRTLKMNSEEMAQSFPPQALIRQVANGKEKMPRNEQERAIYEVQLIRYNHKQEKKNDAADQNEMQPSSDVASKVSEVLGLGPDARMQTLLGMAAEQRSDFLLALKGSRDEFLSGMSPEQRENVMAMYNPQQVVTEELMQAKILRATYSQRQLQEVMTDFWMNHFNVFIGKGADRYQLTSYERDVVRPRALGKFEDLLVATAKSPAMLFYLDNWLSVGPDSDFARGIRRQPRRRMAIYQPPNPKKRPSGLNENYGRELMELHTLGVNGGYTQKDVTEVAKVFTGWTLKEPREGGGYFFDERKHEPGTKIVLGHKIKEDGEKEGREVLHLLAHDPHTAKFVCNKLAMRFVSDNPPPALVNEMAATFLKKDGDIREVLKTMLQSPDFWSAETYRAKVKTPLEFVVSSLRATDAQIDNAMPMVRQLQTLGMPLYGAQPPTGYSMRAETWVNSSALLGRMNFAVRLASGKIRGVAVETSLAPAGTSMPDAGQVLSSLENSLLECNVSKQTHDTIMSQLNDPEISQRRLDDPARAPDVSMIEGLLLGSPEFQRR
ncbi:MAG TPA: DUF1800 domain-containing protein [Terriglobales bacterium]|nr:DUF1800 domain-containing protein [Terriglobales bacterium]